MRPPRAGDRVALSVVHAIAAEVWWRAGDADRARESLARAEAVAPEGQMDPQREIAASRALLARADPPRGG